jgi:hypothetical protein
MSMPLKFDLHSFPTPPMTGPTSCLPLRASNGDHDPLTQCHRPNALTSLLSMITNHPCPCAMGWGWGDSGRCQIDVHCNGADSAHRMGATHPYVQVIPALHPNDTFPLGHNNVVAPGSNTAHGRGWSPDVDN